MPVFLGTSNIENFNLGTQSGNTVYLGKQLITGEGFQTTSDTVLLNAANIASYPGSGSVWNDLVGNSIVFEFSQNAAGQGNIEFTGSNSFKLNQTGFGTSNYTPYIYNSNTELLNLENGQPVSIYSVFKTSNVFNSVQQLFAKQTFQQGNNFAGYALGIGQSGAGANLRKVGIDFTTDVNQGRLLKQVSGSLANNTWYHICATWDGNTTTTNGISLYVNGVTGSDTLIDTVNVPLTGSISNNFRPFIGVRAATNVEESQYFNGRIGAVYVYKNRVLTPSDVSDLYTSLSSSFTN
jgi:hypothetical protein